MAENPPDSELGIQRPAGMSYGSSNSAAPDISLFKGDLNAASQRGANPPPDFEESSATASSPKQFFARRTGDTVVPDLELGIRRRTDMSAAPDDPLFGGVDPVARQQTRWTPDDFVRAGTLMLFIVGIAPHLLYLAFSHPCHLVFKISASLYTVIVSVTLILLLIGWTRDTTMVRKVLFWAHLELLLMWILFLFGSKCIGER